MKSTARAVLFVLVWICQRRGVEGRVSENSPGDCFPAPPLRPQTGDSPRLHQNEKHRESGAFCFGMDLPAEKHTRAGVLFR